LGERKRRLKPASINRKLATQVVKEIAKEYSPMSIMTFGGEPLLYPEVVCAIHEAAKSLNIGTREIITNAGYPRSKVRFQMMTNRLAETGVTHATVSVDSFHQEYIPISIVKHNAQALLDAGISVEWNPCWLISKTHKNQWNEKTKTILKDLAHIHIREGSGNIVQPKGNALIWLSDLMPLKTIDPKGTCEDIPYTNSLDKVTSISVEPDGEVLVCNRISIGNARENSILYILNNYDPYKTPELSAILQGGTTELIRFADTKGVKPDPNGYYSICDLCIDLRSRLTKTNNPSFNR